jgi:hypothetical protein
VESVGIYKDLPLELLLLLLLPLLLLPPLLQLQPGLLPLQVLRFQKL